MENKNKFEGMKTAELEKKIKERLEQIKRIVGFVDKLTNKAGTVVSCYEESCYTHIVKKIDGFKDFSFLANTGHGMMGGNDFHVWYHPDKKEIDKKQCSPVFSVYYQVSIEDESEVNVFDPGTEWQDALNEMIDRQDEIMAEIKKQKEEKVKQRELQEEDVKKREILLGRAQKLKL